MDTPSFSCHVLGVLERRVVERHDAVAHVLVDRAPVLEHDLGHLRQVLAEHHLDLLRLEPLGDRREAADVGKEHRGDAAAGTEALLVAGEHQRAQDVGREER